ncbi:hypothetical protein JAAARDRAFT_40607 [Jaapia argillacea MUCL 33604]|uniref:Uncharacterized protein n=1 Tax=Jaapia argillacea MUCL 33604 TaxID=933084 RepID=A0A067PNU7_9AGAM|nr:hypothetical protein JAAARDRAFT_40607 [Jaapia argillacea MUCL 33604]
MAWLVSGQIAFILFGTLSSGIPHLSPSTIGTLGPDSGRVRKVFAFIVILPVLVLSTSAVGGFVTVGRMLAEFGTCSLAP